MPGLVRKLLIFAAVDGLVLQPQHSQSRPKRSSSQHRPNPRVAAGLKIDYASHSVTRLNRDTASDDNEQGYGADNSPQSISRPLEAYGIVGLLRVFDHAYLISITQRKQVANLWGKPVYAITGVAIVPLTSQQEAQKAIDESREDMKQHKRHHPSENDELSTSDDTGEGDQDEQDHTDDETIFSEGGDSVQSFKAHQEGQRNNLSTRRVSGILEEVVGRTATIGKTASSWFSSGSRAKNTNVTSDRAGEEQRQPKYSVDSVDSERVPQISSHADIEIESPDDSTGKPQTAQEREHMVMRLLPRIVQTMKLLLNSHTFFYSYEVDITRSLKARYNGHSSKVPLYKQADDQYFFNHNLLDPFIDCGHSDFVLPVMQGFVGQRQFSLSDTKVAQERSLEPASPTDDEHQNLTGLPSPQDNDNDNQTFLLTLISRRSIDRAGLRFLRRGIDEQGHTANFNETEQILSTAEWSVSSPVLSYLQVRGSIPIFFTQTPYTFKPLPVLGRNDESNDVALRKHLSEMTQLYGKVHAVSLVDRHGTEISIGEAYERRVQKLNAEGGVGGQSVGFDWFEFHKVCSGMRFEKVSILVETLEPFLDSCSWTVLAPIPSATSPKSTSNYPAKSKTQSGIIRTNCMDCLDRTNVVQSALAARILTQQLQQHFHLNLNLQNDPSTAWFNTLWADNGDAISRAYAGTSALKGDYTRTRSRNAFGALTDLSLTLARYKKGMFDDGFAQGVIDYVLGNVDEDVFEEFETSLANRDVAVDVGRARQMAIAMAVDVVLGGNGDNGQHNPSNAADFQHGSTATVDKDIEEDDDEEDLGAGWSLLTPRHASTLRSPGQPLQEIVLLLTNLNLYVVRFDGATGKVSGFERVPLASIQDISWGTYVTEVNVGSQMDEKKNVGFVVWYRGQDVRLNTRSLDSSLASAPTGTTTGFEDAKSAEEMHVSSSSSNSEKKDTIHFLAFKALPSRSPLARRSTRSRSSSFSATTMSPTSPLSPKATGLRSSKSQLPPIPTERDTIRQICVEIQTAIANSRRAHVRARGEEQVEGGDEGEVRVREEDVMSKEAAMRSTGLVERMGYKVKRFVWG